MRIALPDSLKLLISQPGVIMNRIDSRTRNIILGFQKCEITEYHIYRKLAERIRHTENRKILNSIADDELRHYDIWKKFTGTDVKPRRFRVWKYVLISRLLGLSFGLRLMEKGEENAQKSYQNLNLNTEEILRIIDDEEKHEEEVLGMLDEDFLQYTSSMVLGLNDALVELTGALAGFTLALQNSKLIALVGLVTGIAASLSMASSEYLSTKSEAGPKNPFKAALYTGIAYILTVFILICPFLILTGYFSALVVTMAAAVLIICIFNFYISVAKELSFKKQFFEMAGLSLGVASLSFLIGHLLRTFLKVDI